MTSGSGPASERAAIVDGIEEWSVPLATDDLVADLRDLEPLREAFAGKRIVGLGESTHGAREFFRLKHRLFRFLVEELDVRVLAWEANFSAATAIDEYVRHGRADPADALASEAIHWPWRSEAVLDLIEWIRAFNEGRDPDDRVRFYGLDVQYPAEAAAALESYLSEADPDALDDVAESLAELAAANPLVCSKEETAALLRTARQVTATLTERFDDRASAYVEATSPSAFERAKRHRWALSRAVERADGEDPLRVRETAMAENVSWVLDHESADRIALWGHNAHVKRGTVAGGNAGSDADALGEHLHREYGEEYYALGFEFARGSVRVHSLSANEFEAHEVGSPPAGSLPDVLGDVDSSPLFVDLDGASTEPTVGTWLDGRPRRYSIVGSYRDDPVSYTESNPADAFDGLVFVEESTPTTPTERVLPNLDLHG